MYVRIKEKANGKKSVQIVEAYRKADKVRQKIIRHVGQAVSDREVEELKRLAESIIVEMRNNRQPVLPLFSPEEIYGVGGTQAKGESVPEDTVKVGNLREEQRVVEGIGEVFGKLYDNLGLREGIGNTRKDEAWNGILKACVLARIANPSSKHRTASLLEEDYAVKIALQKIYRMMDHLVKQEDKIRSRIACSTLSVFQERVDVLFFDVTTLFLESVETDELRDFGYSKDCKFKETQVVLALVTTTEGMPITYRLFPGNMYEGHTLIEMVSEIRKVYDVGKVLLVADRAMFSEDNLGFMDKQQICYIVAARLRKLPKDLRDSILASEDFTPSVIEKEFHWVKEFPHGIRRLIVSYSSSRAMKDAKDRSRLIERLLKKARDGKVKIRDVIPNYGTKKYLVFQEKEVFINEARIEQEAQWDGLHGVITNATDLSPAEILFRYRGLWQIEESFRISKHDLKMRPIYHWTPDRIRAHILICFMAYALARQAMYRTARQQQPMSFEQIRNELLHVQSSIVQDISTGKRYILPSHMTVTQKKIYQVFGLKRSDVPRYMP
jgi:transposase